MNEVEDFDFRLEAEMRYNRQKVCHGGVLLCCELTFEKPNRSVLIFLYCVLKCCLSSLATQKFNFDLTRHICLAVPKFNFGCPKVPL